MTFEVLSSLPVARPGHDNYEETPELADLVKTTMVRVKLQGHQFVKQDKHFYYGIYEIIIAGRCFCHGHANTCDMTSLPYVCNCLPESNAEGGQVGIIYGRMSLYLNLILF